MADWRLVALFMEQTEVGSPVYGADGIVAPH